MLMTRFNHSEMVIGVPWFSKHNLRRIWLAFATLLIAACQASSEGDVKSQISEQPNILWVMSEDMGPELGAYGTPQVKSPVIDALAKDGMVFEQAFTTAPICSISRSALYTGMYQTSIGAHQHRTLKGDKRPLPVNVALLTDHFRKAGYFTALLTKVSKDEAANTWLNPRAKTDWNFTYEGEPYDSNNIADLKDNQPFFAHVQFAETHRGRDWEDAINKIDHPAEPEKVDIPPYYPDHPIVREDWADYLNAVMAFDLKTGIVLERLKEEGLTDNTIVIVLSDHGRAMVRGKQWLYDSGLHIPLIIYVPEGVELPYGFKRGSRSKQLVSGIDITATTLALGGAYNADGMQGRPFLGGEAQVQDYVYAARDRADETSDYMRTVRSDKFRYIKNFYPDRPYTQFNAYKETEYAPYRLMFRLYNAGMLGPIPSLFFADRKPEEELFDVVKDPHNVKNLANDPAYTGVLADMRGRLADWQEETGDMGRVPEDPAVAIAISKKGMKKRRPQIAELEANEGVWRPDGIPTP
ncbi:sulfatase family protein [Robiginitomaculum antarcticum]|uniref:sulfatase family protein n=1 Tax=Robiginitomaculum antarcticum TaxID=437507 RepID=UPI00035D697B|nr:sulfatase [Robiginitomaculum antarcticum]